MLLSVQYIQKEKREREINNHFAEGGGWPFLVIFHVLFVMNRVISTHYLHSCARALHKGVIRLLVGLDATKLQLFQNYIYYM